MEILFWAHYWKSYSGRTIYCNSYSGRTIGNPIQDALLELLFRTHYWNSYSGRTFENAYSIKISEIKNPGDILGILEISLGPWDKAKILYF